MTRDDLKFEDMEAGDVVSLMHRRIQGREIQRWLITEIQYPQGILFAVVLMDNLQPCDSRWTGKLMAFSRPEVNNANGRWKRSI